MRCLLFLTPVLTACGGSSPLALAIVDASASAAPTPDAPLSLPPSLDAAGAAVSASSSSASSSSGSPPAPSSSGSVADVPPVPRVYVRAHSLPIHADATLKGDWIGMLVAGDSVALRADRPASVHGCASVRAIEPRGWVCVDGDGATLDAADSVYLGLRAHCADYASPWPYYYGESRGTRRQRVLPGVQTVAWPPVVFDPRAEVAPHSTVAWTDEVAGAGSTWLRGSDMSFVAKDKIIPFDRVPFHGVELGKDAQLPLAFFKGGPHIKYRRGAKNRLTQTGDTWPRLGWIGLTGQTEKRGGLTFWETREDGVWIDARGAAVIAPEAPASAPHGTWIEVAALQGWLVAWQGDTAVYATMISAGKLGAAKHDPDHEPHQAPATTPLGTFHIREKALTATLQSDLDDGTDFIHAEVPWSQRFFDKYLLHTAYWHDRWGEGHSGGCVNLAPTDAKWLFAWSEPRVPDGWHAVRASETGANQGSVVVVHP